MQLLNFNNRLTTISWTAFSIFIVYGTLIPFDFCFNENSIASRVADIQWVPFTANEGHRSSLSDVIQNVMLFIPWGMLGFFAYAKRSWADVLKIVSMGMLLSSTVELLQLLTVDRISSVTDIITNTTGSFIGAAIALKTHGSVLRLKEYESFQRYVGKRYFYPFAVACLIVIIAGLQPFDFAIDPGMVWGKLKKIIADPFDMNLVIKDEGIVFYQYSLFSFISIIFFYKSGQRYAFFKGTVFVLSTGVFLEMMQFLVASRTPSLRDAGMASIGCLGGLLLTYLTRRDASSTTWLWLATIGTILGVSIRELSPFRISGSYYSGN